MFHQISARAHNARLSAYAKGTAVLLFVLMAAGSCGGGFDPYNY